MTFFHELWAYARAGHLVWMAIGWVAVLVAVHRLAPAARRRLRPSTVLLFLALGLVVWGAAAAASGYDDRSIALAALACELLALVGLVQVALPTRLKPPLL